MPTHVRAQVTWFTENQLPRDNIVVNPCFRWANLTIQDAESLANNVLDTINVLNEGPNPWKVGCKVYDLEGTKPVLPMADIIRNPNGGIADRDAPREVSLCLSFSGGQHQPRQRGRLYTPIFYLSPPLTKRPPTAKRDLLINWGKALHDVGGANVDWIVWSRRALAATGISRIWVDDEWDTVRSRGLRATTRTQFDF